MAQIIADTYEILERIGSGGGGVVYRGRHIRLDKQIVLKADRRTLTASPETLKREVNTLKCLSHTYIPQVYDFLPANDVVYTVIDYIEGESLDKPLQRGERFAQPEIVEWACELLEALAYLHSIPPHGILHADIKPANIMLTPKGDIRLIDFNIALALGEEGAVQVGLSQGYASPEHYGIDYTGFDQTQRGPTGSTTQMRDDPRTRMGTGSSSISHGRTEVLLDVRSDIYSVGATFYHLLTGRKPFHEAPSVTPIQPGEASPALAAVISKAMQPDPDLRYQTAAEMLYDMEHLHDLDPRTKKRKQRIRAVTVGLALTFLLGGGMTFLGQKQINQEAEAKALEQERLAVLAQQAEHEARTGEQKAQEEERKALLANEALEAVQASEEAYRNGDLSGAVRLAVKALDSPCSDQARKVLTDALGVYDLSSGFKSHLLIELPSEPMKLVFSPSGSRMGVIVSGQALVFDTASGQQLAALPAEVSALSDIIFSDEDTILYAGDGGLRSYDLAEEQELWAGEPATAITLSADRSTVAAVYKDEDFAIVYDAVTGTERQRVDFEGQHLDVSNNDLMADPGHDLFKLNGDGSLLAVSFAGGGLQVFNLWNREDDLIFYEDSDVYRFEGGFCGNCFAFSAKSAETSDVAVFDVDAMEVLWSGSSKRAYHMQADESGIYVGQSNFVVSLDTVEGTQEEIAVTDSDITSFEVDSSGRIAAATSDGVLTFFDGARLNSLTTPCGLVGIAGGYAAAAASDTPALRVFKLDTHSEAQTLSYDADYLHSEARMSGDGQTFMLFQFDQFRIYDQSGTVIADVPLPTPEGDRIYDQQFRRDENGSRLEVIYYSGLTRVFSAEDGSLLSESMEEPPDESIYEEFQTDRLRIERPLHGTPTVYDRETGELAGELEAEDYLTYVTQVDEGIITEYMTAKGERYGLLLNDDLEVLARMPDLCDIMPDGMLLFDDMAGTLRQSRIYSLQELTALAK